MKFNAFGKVIALEKNASGSWMAWQCGHDGKRQKMELAIPDDLRETEMEQYLFDVFHEEATPWNGEIRRLDQ